MTAILFDATTYRNANMGFGEGLLPTGRPAGDVDLLGNRVPRVQRTVADELWYQSDLQRRMDEQAERDAEVAMMYAEDDALAQWQRESQAHGFPCLEGSDLEWAMKLHMGRGPVTDYDAYPHGRI